MVAKKANAVQRKWMSDIAEWAQEYIGVLYGDDWSGTEFQLHHVLGRSAKHNKVEIGHWFILPVPFVLHDVSSNHELNVTHRKKAFIREFGMQYILFEKMVISMEDLGYKMPDQKTYNAIWMTKV